MNRILYYFLLIFVGFSHMNALSQNDPENASQTNDTLDRAPIIFTTEAASQYIISLVKGEQTWRYGKDTLRLSLSRLVEQYNEPYDSVTVRLMQFDYDQIDPQRSYYSRHDTLPLRWLHNGIFIVDTVPLEKDPFITRTTIFVNAIDTTLFSLIDTIPQLKIQIDSLLMARDTILETFIDVPYLESKNIQIHQVINDSIVPSLLLPNRNGRTVRFVPDSSHIVISKSSRVYMASKDSPFFIVPGEMMPDSLRSAVHTLLAYTDNRDSTLLFISDTSGQRRPFWLSNQVTDMSRFWVKNHENDSITIWIGNPTRRDLLLVLEEDVYVERMEKLRVDDVPITTLQPQRTPVALQPLAALPASWQYNMSTAFTLNQTHLSNWARGGESSFASMLDIRAGANYSNTQTKRKWENSGRLRYGTVVTKEHGFRTNTDMLEMNSQYNKVLGEKIDFSSVLYFKTQVAKGYKFPNDSVPVSKFLNPGTFTVGAGFEYKPFKNTLLNFSLLSYRNTFVLDTANINQRAHGVDLDKRARQEMGGQLVIRNRVTILDGLNVTNAVRLFSNYLDKPQNVDVDWEINLDKQINWYFLIRLNFHFIYDDDILFTLLDRNNNPILRPDGTERKAPQLQFKQFLGLTLSFRI